MGTESTPNHQRAEGVRARAEEVADRARRTLAWQIWSRMLEIEFVDRSIALAGKAFVSFFPLVIVVAAFMPSSIRSSIISTLTHRLGIHGDALVTARRAFASASDIRRATGILGLVLTFFFATSFTTALQRVYLRAWRRPPGSGAVGAYARGPAWLVGLLTYMAALGGLRALLGAGPGLALFVVASLAISCLWWWFTAWFLLQREVRWRVLLPSALITGALMSAYAVSATIWMPIVVTRNQTQFGVFGLAVALVTWFSGAAIAITAGACAGPVLAEDQGPVGALTRGPEPGFLVAGAPPPLPAPTRPLRARDALRPTEDDATRSGR